MHRRTVDDNRERRRTPAARRDSPHISESPKWNAR